MVIGDCKFREVATSSGSKTPMLKLGSPLGTPLKAVQPQSKTSETVQRLRISPPNMRLTNLVRARLYPILVIFLLGSMIGTVFQPRMGEWC
jgi:hypothetical protein